MQIIECDMQSDEVFVRIDVTDNPGNSFQVELKNFKNPFSTKPVSGFTVELIRSSSLIASDSTGSISGI